MIDPMTGLPHLPEGYFFRVLKWDYEQSEYSLKVELHKVLPPSRFTGRKRSVVVGDSIARHTEEDVRRSAQSALSKSQAAIAKSLTIADRDQFVGDYPPNRLGEPS